MRASMPLDESSEGLRASEEDWLLSKARELFDDGEYEEADVLCRRVEQINGPRADEARNLIEAINHRLEEVMFARAVEYYKKHNYAKAQSLFEIVENFFDGPFASAAREYLDQIQNLSQEWSLDVGSSESVRPELPSFSDYADVETTAVDASDDVEFGSVEPAAPDIEERTTLKKEEARLLIRRTPHMDIQSEQGVRPGAKLEISVFVDQEQARPEEDSEDVEIRALPSMTVLETQVRLLATDHFTVNGDDVKRIDIHRNVSRSESADFKVTVKQQAALAEQREGPAPSLTAVFAYNGRVSGKVKREIRIIGDPIDRPAPTEANRELAVAETKRAREGITIDALAEPAELTVEIIAAEDNDGRHFWCTVRVPWHPGYAKGVTQKWNLPDVTSNIVTRLMEEFTTDDMSNLQRLTSLKGAGRKLFDASPAIFQRVFWELVDARLLPQTISIVSEEPYIPWELMIPRRKVNGQSESRLPLGVEFAVGRWIPKHAKAALQKIPMRDCYVIAPTYKDSNALRYAQEESAFLLKRFPAPAGVSIRPADFDTLSATFHGGGKTVVHFACHGSVTAGRHLIYLESEPPLSAEMVLGMEDLERAFEQKKPFVFLNACEIGRQAPALAGIGGFAESFIDLGASAVIAPLWSVKDDIAHEIAQEFYNAVSANPERTFAEIMQTIRARAYDLNISEDTYAAYCFYGDPLSSAG